MPNIDLSILNQRQTPAFYADVFANRPAAGFVGRIFVSTDTYAFYRDNGTGWDLIGGPGTGTVTGSGASGQVAFWSGSSLISGENNLWWDSTNNHFGINTNTPGTAADIHHDQSTILQLNQTTATNDTRIAFQNGGSSKWRVGNFYSAGSNDYKVNDAVLNINRFTIKSSSGQTFVGDETTSSGLFVVNNSSGDAHIVALGATAPSIRVRNAGVGASLQFGLGLATTTNNFIQGATGGEFCIFNDSLTAQPILFGIKDAGLGNTQEAARISAARNFLVGTTTDAGQKLQVSGTALITGAATFNSAVNVNSLVIKNSGVPAISAYRDLDVTIFGTVGQGIEFGAKSSSTYISGAAIYGTLDNPATTGSLVLQTLTGGSLTTKLTIASTGAATFSNSVTATGLIVNTTSQFTAGGTAVNSIYASGPSTFGISNSDAIYLRRYDVGQYQFQTVSGGASGGNLSLQSYGGNVGIGTTSPAYALDIASGDLRVTTNAAPRLVLFNTGATGKNWSIYSASSGNLIIGRTGVSDIMAFTDPGNVLIGTTTDTGQKLQVNGTITGTTYLGNRIIGVNYSQTSTAANTSIVDTGINYNTSIIGYSTGAIYQLSIVGNPNSGGSAQYINIKLGYVIINTGYNGSAVTTYITYQELINGNATGVGGFTVSAVFWNGSSEVTNVNVNTSGVQIRIKIFGYNPGVIGDYQEVRLTKINA